MKGNTSKTFIETFKEKEAKIHKCECGLWEGREREARLRWIGAELQVECPVCRRPLVTPYDYS